MRNWRTALTHPGLAALLVLVCALPGSAQTRIFGTNSSGQAVPIQVASDGSLKIMLLTSGFEFEGSTDDAFETTLAAIDPTADNAINLPNLAGTVALVENKLSVFAATTSAELAGVISNETGTGVLVFDTAPVFTTSATAGLLATQDVLKLLPVTSATRFTGILTVADLTVADKTWTFPNLTGTVALMGGVQNGSTFDATGFLVGGVAGIDKTCGGPVVSATVTKGLITAMVCTS